jgi:fatty-acyl-CoA synthase
LGRVRTSGDENWSRLRSFGLRPGDRVGVWARNCVEWVLLQFGCAMAEIVLVNVNPASVANLKVCRN